ncbi:Peptide chain release factor 2 [Candidatus Annandia adelgestsuga]|uniref:Peptide chain release factor 2 n=1 Tax=Candidatus Annandia adelgestsuga TaxID=1302411 RepID=A0A3S9J7K4_9ENTR|nr:PCRF domain-containing protein [Candidatus Annandia adelgestsuga]AZP36273.1 Peptide chain release factor 2 [Candidatus Annandia adelgestsuga]
MLKNYYKKKKNKNFINYYKIIKFFYNYKIKFKFINNINNILYNINITKKWKKSYNVKLNKKKNNFIIKNINNLYLYIIKLKYLLKIFIINNIIIYYNKILFLINKILLQLEKLELNCIFIKKNDKYNCYLDLHYGIGGKDSKDWTSILMKMYLKWSLNKGFKINILKISFGNIIGIKSATIYIKGKYAFGWLKNEIGIHRLVRKSPFDINKKRHTSFSIIYIYPEINIKKNIKIKIKDLKIDLYKSSGSGGQHINKTKSAVRITHIPTNTVTQCQNYKSQHINKNIAIKQIVSKLYKIYFYKKKIKNKNYKLNICWKNKIRSYILDNSLIKDFRTGIEKYNIKSILDINILNFFLKSNLKNKENKEI